MRLPAPSPSWLALLVLFAVPAALALPGAAPPGAIPEGPVPAAGPPGADLAPPVPLSAELVSGLVLQLRFDEPLEVTRALLDPASYRLPAGWEVVSVAVSRPDRVDLLVAPTDAAPAIRLPETELAKLPLRPVLGPGGPAPALRPDAELRTLGPLPGGLTGPGLRPGPEAAALDPMAVAARMSRAFRVVGEQIMADPVTGSRFLLLVVDASQRRGAPATVEVIGTIEDLQGNVLVPQGPLPVIEPKQNCAADVLVDGAPTPLFVDQICESAGLPFQIYRLDGSESTPDPGESITSWDWGLTFPPAATVCVAPLPPDCMYEVFPFSNDNTGTPRAQFPVINTGTFVPYVITLEITDSAGCVNSATLVLLVIPFPAIADPPGITVTDSSGDGTFCSGEELFFQADVTDNSAIPTDSVLFFWDMDTSVDSDGDTDPANDADATGTTPTGTLITPWTYPAPGNYDVHLLIQDGDSGLVPGFSEPCTAELDGSAAVVPGASAEAGGPYGGCEATDPSGTQVPLDGTGSDLGGGGPVTFEWTTDAGTFLNSGTANSTIEDPIIVLPPGTTTANPTLTVTAQSGCASTDTAVVQLDAAPQADARDGTDPNFYTGCETFGAPQTRVQLDGFGTDPAGGNPVFAWTTTAGTFEDTGTTASALEDPALLMPSGTLAADLTLVVTSGAGCTRTDTAQVLLDPAPVVDAGGPYERCEDPEGIGTRVAIDGTATDPGGDPVTIAWQTSAGTFEDSGTNTSDIEDPVLVVPAGTFAADLSLVVTTEEGCVGRASTTVTLRPLPTADANASADPDFYTGCETPDLGVTRIPLDGGWTDPLGGTPTFAWTTTAGTFEDTGTATSALEDPVLLLPVGVLDAELEFWVNGTNGCSRLDQASVRLDPAPRMDAGGPYQQCEDPVWGGARFALDGTVTIAGGGAVTTVWRTTAGIFDDSGTDTSLLEDPVLLIPAGVFSATLTLTGTSEEGCVQSDTAEVTVWAAPVAEPNGPYQRCAASYEYPAVTFTLDASGSTPVPPASIAEYAWSVADVQGGTAVLTGADTASPEITLIGDWPDTVVATVALVVTDSNGCLSAEARTTVTMTPIPLLDLGGPYETCAEPDGTTEVHLDASRTDPFRPFADFYHWEIVSGPGTLLGEDNPYPVLIYAAFNVPQATTVRLTVTTADGCVATGETTVTVFPPPAADAGGPYALCEESSLALDGTATARSGGTVEIFWTASIAGAGFLPSASVEDPLLVTPVGSADGTVQIEVREAASATTTCAATDWTTVDVVRRPLVDAGGPYAGCAGTQIQLDGSASAQEGGTIRYAWSFIPGGGSFLPSNDVEDPALLLPPTGGSGFVVLTVTEEGGGAVACEQVSVAEVTIQPPVGLAPTHVAEICSGVNVSFDAGVSGGTPPIAVLWDFGDGSTGSGEQTSHVYLDPGVFTVNVQATDAFGCGAWATSRITVHEAPRVSFTHTAPVCDGVPVQFDATIAGGTPPIAIAWDLGDGTTSAEEDLEHLYASAGFYTATITVTSANGCSATAWSQIRILPLPVIQLFTDAPACPGETIRFAASVTSGTAPVALAWDLGDGSTASGPAVAHAYDAPGVYDVRVTALDAAGCGGQASLTAQVLDVTLDLEPLGYDDTVLNGNGNGVPDPGETLALGVLVTNLGADAAPAVEVRIVSVEGPAVAYSDRDPVGTIPGGGTGLGVPFLQIDPDAPCGDVVTIVFQASVGGTHCTAAGQATLRIGAPAPSAYGQEVRITEEATHSHGPSLARGAGMYGLAWSDGRYVSSSSGEEVIFQRLTDPGYGIPYPERVSTAAGLSREASVAWHPLYEEFLIVWSDNRTGEDALYGARFDRNGLPLGPTFPLFLSPGREPAVAAGMPGYVLAWRAGDAVEYTLLNELGRPQGTPRTLSSGPGRGPAVAWSGTSAGVVWEEGSADSPSVWFRAFDELGEPLSPRRSAGGTGSSREPDVAWSGWDFIVVWSEGSPAAAELRAARFDPAGTRTMDPLPFTDPIGARAPSVAAGWFGPAVAYLADGAVQVAGFGAYGALGMPTLISLAGAGVSEPDIAWAPDVGEFLVAWTDLRYGAGEILVRRVGYTFEYYCEPVDALPLPDLREVKNLQVARDGKRLVLSWKEVRDAAAYRIYRGELDVLHWLDYNHRVEPPEVGEFAVAGTTWSVRRDLKDGVSHYYLVSALDVTGAEGTLGKADLNADGKGDQPRPYGPVDCP